jgi:DNA invertase Pin-like site-specific DNA recombinase
MKAYVHKTRNLNYTPEDYERLCSKVESMHFSKVYSVCESEFKEVRNVGKSEIFKIIESASYGDWIFIAGILDLCPSITQLCLILRASNEFGINICFSNYDISILNTNIQSDQINLIELVARCNNDLISKRSKVSLKNCQSKGVKIGRPKGVVTDEMNTKLYKRKNELINKLNSDMTIKDIASYFEVTEQALRKHVKNMEGLA